MAKTYKYKIFDLKYVFEYLLPPKEDAYFAEDLNGMSKSDWDRALAEGYRWVRTETDFAVLELEINNEK